VNVAPPLKLLVIGVDDAIENVPLLLPEFVKVNWSVTVWFGKIVPGFATVCETTGTFCTVVVTVFDCAVKLLPEPSLYCAVAALVISVPACVPAALTGADGTSASEERTIDAASAVRARRCPSTVT
jgi:hypothetical protein